MQQSFQDSMALVRKFGKPDLFLSMTCNPCNPKWPEITQLSEPHQKAQDKFDIVTLFFHVKLHKMMKDIVSNKIFGATKAHCYTIEFQKRGLPHAHILLWLEVKSNEAIFYDYVCAEIPDSTIQPILLQSVKSHMMHGPCGVLNQYCPCMKNGHCSHSYPKQLTEVTVALENGKITHRRQIQEGLY
jgi:Helitron helicase-like domain at N-terminus